MLIDNYTAGIMKEFIVASEFNFFDAIISRLWYFFFTIFRIILMLGWS